MTAKHILIYLVTSLSLLLFFSCEKEEKIEPKTPEIILSADKLLAIADGVDKISFKVISDGKDITVNTKILVNNTEIQGHLFSTIEVGTFTVVAKYGEVVSSPIEISFEKRINSNLEIRSSKDRLVSDGADRVILSCIDKSVDSPDNDLTKETIFFVNGQKIEGNIIKTSTAGILKITAHYKTDLVPETQVTASTEFTANQKILAELFAATWCPYCPVGLIFTDKLAKDARVIAMTVHARNQQPDPFLSDEQGVELYRYFEILYIPSLVINRNKSRILSYTNLLESTPEDLLQNIALTSPIGIAMESKMEQDKITAKAYITSVEDRPDLKCTALLIENKLIHDQRNGVIPSLGTPYIKDFQNDHVYRSSHEKNILGKSVSLSAGKPLEQTFAFSSDPSYIIENCEIIVVISDDKDEVINVQKVKIGNQVGY